MATKRSYQFELTSADEDLKGQRPVLSGQVSVPGRRSRQTQSRSGWQPPKPPKPNKPSGRWPVTKRHCRAMPTTPCKARRALNRAAVSDNGKITTFVFPENMVIPAIYLVQGDGTESLVPKTVSGGEVRVHAMAAKFVLRQGDEVLCVFNESYVPEGFATGTMTTSPAVERLTRNDQAVYQHTAACRFWSHRATAKVRRVSMSQTRI